MNLDTNGRIAKVNLVASSILSSNDRRGALRFFRKHRPINPVAPHVSFLPRATCGTETRHDENGGLEEVGNAQIPSARAKAARCHPYRHGCGRAVRTAAALSRGGRRLVLITPGSGSALQISTPVRRQAFCHSGKLAFATSSPKQLFVQLV
jgi:hypothetical protein